MGATVTAVLQRALAGTATLRRALSVDPAQGAWDRSWMALTTEDDEALATEDSHPFYTEEVRFA